MKPRLYFPPVSIDKSEKDGPEKPGKTEESQQSEASEGSPKSPNPKKQKTSHEFSSDDEAAAQAGKAEDEKL